MSAWPVSPATEVAGRALHDLLRMTDPGAYGPHFRHPSSLTEQSQPAPLPATRAAHALGGAVGGLVVEHALLARGAGESWRDLAMALGLEADGSPDVHATYLLLLGSRDDDPWWSPATGVLWLCTACEEAVRDFGPDCGGPDDRESGHAPTCARHLRALTEWKAQWS